MPNIGNSLVHKVSTKKVIMRAVVPARCIAYVASLRRAAWGPTAVVVVRPYWRPYWYRYW